ncbi:hypothetical protein PCE1_003883 [Barthelona sp. PCE]
MLTKLEKRQCAINELVETEIRYLKSLSLLHSLLLEPLIPFIMENDPDTGKILEDMDKDLVGIISVSDFLLLELGICEAMSKDQIAQVKEGYEDPEQKVLHHDLFIRVAETTTIDKVILALQGLSPFFRKYTAYMDSHWALMDFFSKFVKNKSAAEYQKLQELEANPFLEHQNLQGMLIKPVQRIPRYSLVVAEMLKRTEENDPYHQPLTTLLASIDSVATDVNDKLNDMERRRELIDLARKLSGSHTEIFVPHRRLLKTGPCQKSNRRSKLQPRKLILFSDELWYTTETFVFKRRSPLIYMEIVEDQVNVADHGFTIRTPEKTFTLYFEDAIDCVDWRNSITAAINEVKRKSTLRYTPDMAATWIPDDRTSDCMGCGVTFTFFNRRHHCRVCGRIYCSKCTPHRIVISSLSAEPARTCRWCYSEHIGERSITPPVWKDRQEGTVTMDNPLRTISPPAIRNSQHL